MEPTSLAAWPNASPMYRRQRGAFLSHLYRHYGLTRTYYSGFSPVIQTPFENLPATDPLREHRLYQASFLLRDYGWSVDDLPLMPDGNLQLELDPKRAWAEIYLRSDPIDIMKASRLQLLRVPGIGPKGTDAILRARRHGRLTDVHFLKAPCFSYGDEKKCCPQTGTLSTPNMYQ